MISPHRCSILIQLVVLRLNLPDEIGRGMPTLNYCGGDQYLSNVGSNQVSPNLAFFPCPIPNADLSPVDNHSAAFPMGGPRALSGQRWVNPGLDDALHTHKFCLLDTLS